MKQYAYLALGDSYTIGELVRINESFPYQTVYKLRQHGLQFVAPEIIATTGFTTDELNVAIDKAKTLSKYDFVSLLIGVNNQYRGKPVSEFAIQFENLLQRAIQFADNKPQHVFVLSIPDWGVTPFASDRDTKKIAAEIDAFNMACELAARNYKTNFIDITSAQRADNNKPGFLAADKLHPSAIEYEKWATLLSEKIRSSIGGNNNHKHTI
jgi:lysophospholipase L1-like esterase